MACGRPIISSFDTIVCSSRRLVLSQTRNTSSTSTVNAEEIAKFSSFSANWWNPRGEFAPLHRLNSLRVPLVKEVASSVLQSPESPTSEPPPAGTGSVSSHGNSLENLHVLDIGCGGGLLSEPMARLGASVLGVDASKTSIDVARHHASQDPALTGRLRYQCGAAEDLPTSAPFDIVVASEVIEHVADQRAFVETCCQLVRPGGAAIFTTLNRTCLSYALGIQAAEFLGLAPAGAHEWDKFISPEDLSLLLLNVQGMSMRVELTRGMTYNPVTQRWSWSEAMPINYALVAAKSPSLANTPTPTESPPSTANSNDQAPANS